MPFPCIDPVTRRYTSGLCRTCDAPTCWAGEKPVKPPEGYRPCKQCGRMFWHQHKHLYCSDACRKEGMYARRRQRRADRKQTGVEGSR